MYLARAISTIEIEILFEPLDTEDMVSRVLPVRGIYLIEKEGERKEGNRAGRRMSSSVGPRGWMRVRLILPPFAALPVRGIVLRKSYTVSPGNPPPGKPAIRRIGYPGRVARRDASRRIASRHGEGKRCRVSG